MWRKLSEDDSKDFIVNISNLNWNQYLDQVLLAMCMFMLKNETKKLPEAIKKRCT
jgi:hypothetical protein